MSGTSDRFVGPLAPFAAGFRSWLRERGYSREAIRQHVLVLADLSRWLGDGGLSGGDATVARAEEFLHERRCAGRREPASLQGMRPLLEYLGGLELAATAVPEPPTAVEVLLGRYERFLVEERGFCSTENVADYVELARVFCDRNAVTTEVDLGKLTAAAVTEFLFTAIRGYSRAHAHHVVTKLRSWLRFAYVSGLTSAPLAVSVPSVACWSATSLPPVVPPGVVTRLLKSCDRRRTVRRRDYAIVLLLARLGLRAGEVADLRLDDIDWRAGELTVRGKGNRRDPLPLPADVGAAIASWLRRRPRNDCPNVFTLARAPYQAMTRSAVSMVVRLACRRTGIPPMGAHRLRHFAATRTLQAGASLTEVGQVLRHRSQRPTAGYAKVDRDALIQVARPWPSGCAS